MTLRQWACVGAAVLALGGCASIHRNPEALERAALQGQDHLLFTSFRPDTDYTGLYLLYSRNGYSWMALNGDRPVFADPEAGIRDPHLARGPDGAWHLVWTGGGKQEIGYATSPDLVNWSRARRLAVMGSEPASENCWAPELVYDEATGEWIIHWSSTVTGRFAETAHEGDRNHRIYFTTTRDFRSLEPARLLFDPGFNVIDSSIAELGGRHLLFFKDERSRPAKKRIMVAEGDSVRGPWRDVSRTVEIRWIEGPSAVRLGAEHVVYYDFYRRGRYGGMTSRDLKSWVDRTGAMTFPPGHRHGSVVRIDAPTAERLLALRPGN